MTVRIELLQNIPAFGKLDPATLKQVAQVAMTIAHRAGESFYRQGDPPTGLFALQAGRVKLYRQSKERVQILAIPMPGDCFGAESLPNDTPSPCAATALTPTSCVYIPPDTMCRLLGEYPDFQEVLLELVSARLRQFVSLVHNLAFRDVTSRLAMVLLTRAETEGKPTDKGICIDRLLSQQEFAAMVGTAREVIYRTFKKFEGDGLVRLTSKNIIILDLERLATIASQELR